MNAWTEWLRLHLAAWKGKFLAGRRKRLMALATLAVGLLAAIIAMGTVMGAGRAGVQPSSSAGTTQLTPELDADGDGFYNQLESALGSDPNSLNSTPESHALPDADGNGVADACEDFADNDKDGLTDADDPGCKMDSLIVDLEPGLDIFGSSATITASALGGGMPPETLALEGPAVVKRGEPDGGTLPVEMVAMQLTGDSSLGPVTLIVNPQVRSTGKVTSETGAPPWSSSFEINTLIFVHGQMIAERRLTVENSFLTHLPPVQDSRKVDPSKCYQFSGGLHCPEVPRLRLPVLKWVAKFDCGEQPSTPPPFLGPVKPGDYATKIVIHNPQGVPVNLEKKVSEGLRNPEHGRISHFESVTLPPDATTEVDCADIFRLLGEPIPLPGKQLPFKNGVVVILSTKKLDVIANYTQEVPKEKVEFRIDPPPNAPAEMRALAGKTLKWVTLTHQEVIIDVEAEIVAVLKQQFPAEVVDRTRLGILGDDLGVGSSMDVEAIEPQKCLLVDPPDLPQGQLECEVDGP